MSKLTTARHKETLDDIKHVLTSVAKIVSEMTGIQLGEKQFPMVESRLRSRMIKCRIEKFRDYLQYLNANKESESEVLISLMTTHHTFFFREFMHFEFLGANVLPKLISEIRARQDKTLRVWSAACSRGQEVYSLAMFLKFHLSRIAPDIKFEVYGTDVDRKSVEFAKNGVYKNDELLQSPSMYMEQNWIKGRGKSSSFSKAKDSLLNFCQFETANLLSCEDFLKKKKFDIIFCRNVFIYFSQEQIVQITKTILKHLNHTGFLFLGMSESLNGLSLNVESKGPSIYQHKMSENNIIPIKHNVEKVSKNTKLLEVLVIDDSPIIHTLLSKVLSHEYGFKITATARNGKEAIEILKSKKFDVITLDMHMPEMDGLSFLREYKVRTSPILIISAINREQADLETQVKELGAKDYVEKPSYDNLAQTGNEIRFKIKTILAA